MANGNGPNGIIVKLSKTKAFGLFAILFLIGSAILGALTSGAATSPTGFQIWAAFMSGVFGICFIISVIVFFICIFDE